MILNIKTIALSALLACVSYTQVAAGGTQYPGTNLLQKERPFEISARDVSGMVDTA